MDKLRPYLDRLRDEWEGALCAVAILLLVVVLATAGRNLLELLHSSPTAAGGITPTRPYFAATAFRFLGQDHPDATLGADHCFSIKPPRGFRPPQPVASIDPPPNQTRTTVPKPPENVVISRPPDPTPTPTPATPPPPKPKDFLTYKGSMTAPSGQPLAYLEHEHDPGGGQARSRTPAFLSPGTELLGYKIVRFDADHLELTDADGKSHTLDHGKRQRLPARE